MKPFVGVGTELTGLRVQFVFTSYSAFAFGSFSPKHTRKEVIQPQLPLQLPCYDFVPVTGPALGGRLLAVTFPTSGVTNSHDVTGGVYKARERIHRIMLIYGY